MRHQKGFNHLGRKAGHRRALLANMASSLIVHKRITTTLAKAKALRMYVEPLITRSKTDETHERRVVFSYLQDKVATAELFKEVSPKIADRPGGYTRIIKLAPRLGDSADMALIELVDFNELMVKDAKPKKARRSRRGRRSGEATAAPVVAAKTDETKAEETETEVAEAVVETAEAPTEDAPVAEVAEEAPTAEPEVAAAPEAKTEEPTTDGPAEKKKDQEGEDKKES